jgi:hypothetical protein
MSKDSGYQVRDPRKGGICQSLGLSAFSAPTSLQHRLGQNGAYPNVEEGLYSVHTKDALRNV